VLSMDITSDFCYIKLFVTEYVEYLGGGQEMRRAGVCLCVPPRSFKLVGFFIQGSLLYIILKH
jgi:hypothetical protein